MAWAVKPDGPKISLQKAYDGNPATVGNAMMVAPAAKGPAMVDAVHKKALELGAKNEGTPGPRGEGKTYHCYFREPDGNKLSAVHFGWKRQHA